MSMSAGAGSEVGKGFSIENGSGPDHTGRLFVGVDWAGTPVARAKNPAVVIKRFPIRSRAS